MKKTLLASALLMALATTATAGTYYQGTGEVFTADKVFTNVQVDPERATKNSIILEGKTGAENLSFVYTEETQTALAARWGGPDLTIKNFNSLNLSTSGNGSLRTGLLSIKDGTLTLEKIGTVNIGSKKNPVTLKGEGDQVAVHNQDTMVFKDIDNFNVYAQGGIGIMSQTLEGKTTILDISANNINVQSDKVAVQTAAYNTQEGTSKINLTAKNVNLETLSEDRAAVRLTYWPNCNGNTEVTIKADNSVSIKGGSAGISSSSSDTSDKTSTKFTVQSNGDVLISGIKTAIDSSSANGQASGSISGKNVKLVAEKGIGISQENTNLTLTADKLNIDAQTAIFGDKTSSLVIKAAEATLNGDINVAGTMQLDGKAIFKGDKAEVAKLTGDKATFTMTKTTQKVAIENANKDLTLAITGDVNDKSGMQAFDNVALTGEVKGVKLLAEEGMSSNQTTAVYNEKGELTNVVTTTNSIMSIVLDLAAGSTLSLNRIMMSDLRKRLGDLRSVQETHGVWARYNGGKLSGDQNLENEFATVEFGIDTIPEVDAPRFGVAMSYTMSEADMKRGNADMDAFSLAFYGTKMYDSGLYADMIGRMATAKTDFVVDGNKKGSLDNFAMSLSAEMGWRFDLTNTFYVEPQTELTYTYLTDETLTLSEGSSYKLDSVNSLIGRVGFATGMKCPNNFGDIYVRASAVHEFLGDASVASGNNVHELDGKDTWVEFGLGANFNIAKNAYIYADVERTEGAKLEEDWRANIGVRYSF